MRVRFTDFCAGPTGGYPAGTVAEVDDRYAATLIDLGRAVAEPEAPKRQRAVR